MSVRYRFSRELYSKEALLKAAYGFIDDFYITLDCDGTSYLVELEAKRGQTQAPDERAFQNEMLIQETRRTVSERTGRLREMMYARAMASTVIEEEMPEMEAYRADEDEILMDWFEKNEQ